MFLLNLGYRWPGLDAEDKLDGVVILASGNDRERLLGTRVAEFPRPLFDPQLYLAGLDAATCGRACARLATHPWFGVDDLPAFDTDRKKKRDWTKEIQGLIPALWRGAAPKGDDAIRAACLSAIEFQLQLGCAQIILPSPLARDREDEAQSQADWLDAALVIATEDLEIGQPVLATVAVAEAALNDEAFEDGGFLDTVADQVTAREDGLDGVYLVVEQNSAQHPFETSPRVLKAYLKLSRVFSARGYSTVLPNFVDAFGLACMAAGTTGFATGVSHSQRRLSLSGFKEAGGGTPLPHLYSHRSITEFLTEQDLDRIVAKGLLGRVRDVTSYSRPLIEVLAAGRSAAELATWAEGKNNVPTAGKHFMARIANEERTLFSLSPSERAEAVRDWLLGASATAKYVNDRLTPDGIAGEVAPAERWLKIVDEVLG